MLQAYKVKSDKMSCRCPAQTKVCNSEISAYDLGSTPAVSGERAEKIRSAQVEAREFGYIGPLSVALEVQRCPILQTFILGSSAALTTKSCGARESTFSVKNALSRAHIAKAG
jgi:hypothetical protein